MENTKIKAGMSIDTEEDSMQKKISSARTTIFDICIYHKDCCDGIAAFWCVKKWGQNYDVVGIPMARHEQLDRDLLTNKNVILVDICFSKRIMEQLEMLCKYVLVIDHHVYAIDIMMDTTKLDLIFEKDKSACQIAWNIYNPDEPEPNFITYIGEQDRGLGLEDLAGKFTIGWRRKFNHLSYDAVNILYKPENSWLIDLMICQGSSALVKNRERFKVLSKNSFNTYFTHDKNKYYVKICYARYVNKGVFATYLCNEYPDIDFAVVWCGKGGNHTASMRTTKDDIDLIPIANKWGGNGHTKACGLGNINIFDIFDIPNQDGNKIFNNVKKGGRNKKLLEGCERRYMHIIKGGIIVIITLVTSAGIYKIGRRFSSI